MLPPMSSALDDIRVLDISQGIAGPMCAKILGDFGADEIGTRAQCLAELDESRAQ